MYKLGASLVSNRASGQYRKGGNFDPDAKLVIDRMTGLSSLEREAINTFVINEKGNGNYDLYDEFWCYMLGSTNGLIGFKNKTATAFGGLVWNNFGVEFNGVNSYIDTNYNPSVDGINNVLSNATLGVFNKYQQTDQTGNQFMMAADIDNDTRQTLGQFTPTSLAGSINGVLVTRSVDQVVKNNQVLTVTRVNSPSTETFQDGVSFAIQGTQIANDIPNVNFYVGCRNNNGTPQLYMKSPYTSSSTLIAGGDGFNQVAHNKNLRIFLATLQSGFAVTDLDAADAILNADIVDPIQAEITQQFVINEKSANNYNLYDEFFFLGFGEETSVNGFKGSKGVANGGIVWDVDGANFNGTNAYIDSNWTPLTDSINMTEDDASMSQFIRRWDALDFDYSLGQRSSGSWLKMNQGSGGVTSVGLNGTTFALSTGSIYGDNTLISSGRISGNNDIEIYKDGVLNNTSSGNKSGGLVDNTLILGAYRNISAISGYSDCTISSTMFGASIGFNHASHNINVRLLIASNIARKIITDIDSANAIINSGVKDLINAQAIDDFVVAEKATGNYQLYDEFFLLTLGDENSLNGFKGKKAIANGGVTFGIEGATFNGANSYLNTNFNPNIDGVKYTSGDAMLSSFIKEVTITGNAHIVGARNTGNRRESIGSNSSNNRLVELLSGNSNLGGATAFEDNKLVSHSRFSTSANSIDVYENGVEVESSVGTSEVGFSELDLFVGAVNNVGSPNFYFNGIISSVLIGGAIGFNHPVHNTNLRNLLLKSLDPDAIVYTVNAGLTDLTYIKAVSDFIVAEKAVGNYDLYDEFYFLTFGADGLIGLKNQTVATPNGGITYDINGATFNGTTGYIDSGFNPATDGSTLVDDALYGSFVKTAPTDFVADARVMIGGYDGNSRIYHGARRISSNFIRATVNSNGVADRDRGEQYPQDNELHVDTARDSDNLRYHYIDGVEFSSNFGSGVSPKGVPNVNLFVGGFNNNGVANEFYEGTISTAIFAVESGFNNMAHNTNVRQFLTDIGVIL